MSGNVSEQLFYDVAGIVFIRTDYSAWSALCPPDAIYAGERVTIRLQYSTFNIFDLTIYEL